MYKNISFFTPLCRCLTALTNKTIMMMMTQKNNRDEKTFFLRFYYKNIKSQCWNPGLDIIAKGAAASHSHAHSHFQPRLKEGSSLMSIRD